ncbi:MAG: acyl carrier protein, partial [Parcubacteria group bacterium]|nr:acyl carrier protein [Parcubacteria group bacterium]
TDDTSPENTTSWDSFNGLLLATELEKEYKITFSIEEVVAVRRVADIKKALRSRGVPV